MVPRKMLTFLACATKRTKMLFTEMRKNRADLKNLNSVLQMLSLAIYSTSK